MLKDNKALSSFQTALADGHSLLVEELWNAPKAFLATVAAEITAKNILIITGASREQNCLLLDIPFFSSLPIIDFPAWEMLPHEGIPPSPDIVGERYNALQQLSTSSSPQIVISGLQACLQRLITPEICKSLYLHLQVGQTLAPNALIERLEAMGYQPTSITADKGEYSLRGGIVDIFPVSSPSPCRLEFWGDDIESLRLYDPISQTSVNTISQINIPPAQELELLKSSDTLATLLDYLGPNTLVIIDDLLSVEDRAIALSSSHIPSRYFDSWKAFFNQMSALQKIYYSPQPIDELSQVRPLKPKNSRYYSTHAYLTPISCELFGEDITVNRWRHPFATVGEYLLPAAAATNDSIVAKEEIVSALKHLSNNTNLHVVADTERERQQFKDHLVTPAKVLWHEGYLSNGFAVDDSSLLLLPLTEITHRYKIRRQKLRTAYHSTPAHTFDLQPGDLVVHLNNGIGKFLGIQQHANHQGISGEFLHIAYAEGATLYVPIQQAHLVTKYIGATELLPSLHTIGSGRWKKAKEHTQKAIVGYAKELLHLYAQRQLKKGRSCAPDSDDMQSFESEFPFIETEDQLSAIISVKNDMQSSLPMDRLVCGDVGYGKTEVAMRAAFKAVVDGSCQVAVLVPTTVLAMQHYENFVQRMGNFPLRVGVVSRFRSAKEIRQTLQSVRDGSIDILIGTHRIISKDVIFKDLGLIIIDEEQRFGVRAKEHLKKSKLDVDCLTLTATPIPRTLYMAVVGTRDMSVISTPPEDRLPISTIIAEPTDELIKNALLRELARDGQAYVIHNRVETIEALRERIQSLLPHARLAAVHGQMEAHELDAIFHAFRHGEIDILVATTIIENGIDVPNANTILIDRADHYGLATLYQMRGRVGRWNRRAYAYLLVNNKQALREEARERLIALTQASGHGGGIKVAMRDLEIRGAGDLLGTEQSGHVATIGFHFYCKLLKRTIEALQGNQPYFNTELKIEFPIDARLPDSYVNAVNLRLEIYQRLGDALTCETVDAIWKELRDRFGPPPQPAYWLYHLTRLRVQAAALGYVSIKWERLALLTERRQGKESTTRKIPLKPCDDPALWEHQVLQLLKSKS